MKACIVYYCYYYYYAYQQPRLICFDAFLQCFLNVNGPTNPILCSSQRQLHLCRQHTTSHGTQMKMHSKAWMTSAKQPLQLFVKTSWHTQMKIGYWCCSAICQACPRKACAVPSEERGADQWCLGLTCWQLFACSVHL